MSGLRLYVHDAHGRMISGDLRVQKARKARRCEGYRHEGVRIEPGQFYAIAILYPSDSDFTYVDSETFAPSKSAARWHMCMDCAGDSARELLEAYLVGSATKPAACLRCRFRIACRLDVMEMRFRLGPKRNGKRYCDTCMEGLDNARYNAEHYG